VVISGRCGGGSGLIVVLGAASGRDIGEVRRRLRAYRCSRGSVSSWYRGGLGESQGYSLFWGQRGMMLSGRCGGG